MGFADWFANMYYRTRYAILRRIRSLSDNSPLQKQGYELTFQDDFDKVSWLEDSNQKWIVGEHWGGFHPERTMVYFGPPVLMHGKSLAKFEVKYKPRTFTLNNKPIEIPFLGSWLSSAKTFRQLHGRFECRMSLPKAAHTWPAFWLWGPGWPPEIDVIEAYGGKTGKDVVYQHITVWYWNKDGKRTNTIPFTIKLGKYNPNVTEFYEFALEWHPGYIAVYVNGVKVFRFTDKKKIERTYQKPSWVMVDAYFRGDIAPEEIPGYYSSFYVDYVRVYKKKS